MADPQQPARNEPNLLFMIGSGRCGSSIIHETMARHAEVGFISNIDDKLPMLNLKGRFNNAIFRSPIGRMTRKGRVRFAPSEAYWLISDRVSPIYRTSSRNLNADDVTPHFRERFSQFFAERFRSQAKTLFLHKYTGWSRAQFFKEIFPAAKFVHIVRDGRAVANSFLQMQWWTGFNGPENWYLGQLDDADARIWNASDRSYVVLAGLAWKILVESIERDAQKVDRDCLKTVRYEDFVSDPEQCTRDICNFAGLEFSSDFAQQMGKIQIRADREQAYLKDFTKPQLQELESCIGPILDRYGYSMT